MLAQGTRFLTLLLSIVFLPGRIIEEGIHTLAAIPWAKRIAVELDPRAGTAHTTVTYADGTPRWAIWIAYKAPEAVAALAGVSVIGWWALGGAVWWPANALDWVLLSILGAQYLAIALPSAADRDHTPEAES